MTVNKLTAIVTQEIYIKGNNRTIGFKSSEDTDIEYDLTRIKNWISCRLVSWYRLNSLSGQPVFNLKRPITIQIFWNEIERCTLTQKRVTHDMKKNEKNGILFSFKISKYILIPIDVTRAHVSTRNKRTIRPSIHFYEKVFNTIEKFNHEGYKYASPVIFTGMTN